MNNSTPKRLLLADNSSDYRHSLLGLLELENYVVEEAASLEEASAKLESQPFDLALVDLRLVNDNDAADFSGLEIAKRATELGVLCIIVTSFPSVEAARLALRSRGAESLAVDFIKKMDGPQALLDSISLVLTKSNETPEKPSSDQLHIDLDKKLVWNKGKLISLTKNQYALLAYMYERQGGVCKPEELIKAIYDQIMLPDDAMNDHRLKNLIDRVKAKIEDGQSGVVYLVNEYGRGYRLDLHR